MMKRNGTRKNNLTNSWFVALGTLHSTTRSYSYLEFFGPYYFSSPSVKDTWKKYSFFPESDNPFSGFYGNSGKEVKSILSNYKMKSPSIHTDLETLENHMGELASGAQECGAKYVILPSIPSDQRQNLDQYKKMADRFNTIGEAAKKEGVLFAYHNHCLLYTSPSPRDRG